MTTPREPVTEPGERRYDLAQEGTVSRKGVLARLGRYLADPANITPLTQWADRRRFHRFGARSTLMRPCFVEGASSISVGERCYLGRYARLVAFRAERGTVRLEIGAGTLMSPFVHIGAAELVRIGAECTIGAFTWVTDHDHDIEDPLASAGRHARIVAAPTIIGDRAYLGERVAVLRGVTVGEGAIVGTNSVVTKDIPPYTIAVGAPARVIKRLDRATGAWVKA
jgi:acetyltransferase-like isoleucine patch superfamily enzyme